MWRSRSARLSEAAAVRFWLISTKVDRKIASTEASMARITKEGSNFGDARDETKVEADPRSSRAQGAGRRTSCCP